MTEVSSQKQVDELLNTSKDQPLVTQHVLSHPLTPDTTTSSSSEQQ